MDKNCLVSIVVPIYNCEKFIRPMMESIISQTYSNIEIICVSDGCTDQSVLLLNEFAKEEGRIQVIENPDNAGAAVCRNQGLEIAKGEWITFWDADDLYEKTYVSSMIEAADDDTQVMICDYDVIGGIKSNPYIYRENVFDFRNVISCAPCNKLVRKDFLLENKIVFQKLPNCNDFFYSTSCLLKAEHVKYLDQVLWHYRYEQSKNTSRKREKKCYILEALDALYEQLPSEQDEMYKRAFTEFAQMHILGYRKFSSFAEIIREYEEIYREKWNVNISLKNEFYLRDTSLFEGKKIAIVCAGGVGTDYYMQLTEENKRIVGCYDNACIENSRLPVAIWPVGKIVETDFDIAVIAVRDDTIAKQITMQLKSLGVTEEKIWWEKPKHN